MELLGRCPGMAEGISRAWLLQVRWEGPVGAKESRKAPRALSGQDVVCPEDGAVTPGLGGGTRWLWCCCWSPPALVGAGGETRGDWGLQSVLALPSPCSVVSGLRFHLERHWVLAGADSRLSRPPAGTSSFEP